MRPEILDVGRFQTAACNFRQEAGQAGELAATVESNPRFGPLAFETIEKVRRGEKVPTKILLTDRLFDKTNAAQFVSEAY